MSNKSAMQKAGREMKIRLVSCSVEIPICTYLGIHTSESAKLPDCVALAGVAAICSQLRVVILGVGGRDWCAWRDNAIATMNFAFRCRHFLKRNSYLVVCIRLSSYLVRWNQ